MKKIILIAFGLTLTVIAAKAQYVGVKGGLNLSNLNIDKVDDENMRVGYHFGAYLNLPISESFAVQPEVLYSTKGATADYNYDLGLLGSVNGNAQFKLDYIDVPLLAVFRVGDNFEIHAGPYIGFLTSSKYKLEGDFEADGDLDSDSFKNMDFGLIGGLALNFSALQVGARYNYGLQKIEDSSYANTLLGDAKNSYFQIFAAIRIGNYD